MCPRKTGTLEGVLEGGGTVVMCEGLFTNLADQLDWNYKMFLTDNEYMACSYIFILSGIQESLNFLFMYATGNIKVFWVITCFLSL